MKKLLLCIAACVMSANLLAQSRVYCEITEYHLLSNKSIKVLVDFGQERAKPLLNKNILVDAQGKDIVFNSKIDALNYMDSLGWNFLQAYTTVDGSKGSTSSTIHWLLYKDVVEGENPYVGLTTKENVVSRNK